MEADERRQQGKSLDLSWMADSHREGDRSAHRMPCDYGSIDFETSEEIHEEICLRLDRQRLPTRQGVTAAGAIHGQDAIALF